MRALLIIALAAASCSPTPSATPVPSATAEPEPLGVAPDPQPTAKLAEYGLDHVGVVLPGDDVCEKNADGTMKEPIAPGTYEGILRNARCDQQKFLTMARIAQALGVKCNYCHVPHPTDPKKEDYPQFTENKRRANWMFKTFVQGLRPVNGDKVMCAQCHTNRTENTPVARILRDPRDRDFAQEWMHEVMTTKFVEANGKRLKCKTCHGGVAPDTQGWIKDVIRRLRYKGEVERRDDLANDRGE